eukprot:3259995-Alexandrium_andersonii.AAC.1
MHGTRSKSRPTVPSPSALLHLGVSKAPRVAIRLAVEAGVRACEGAQAQRTNRGRSDREHERSRARN